MTGDIATTLLDLEGFKTIGLGDFDDFLDKMKEMDGSRSSLYVSTIAKAYQLEDTETENLNLKADRTTHKWELSKAPIREFEITSDRTEFELLVIADLLTSAQIGDVNALSSLGVIYFIGQGVEADRPRSINYFSKAAKLGNADAYHILGIIYCHGFGVEQDKLLGRDNLILASGQGILEADYSIALFYYEEQDFRLSYHKLLETALKGHELAAKTLVHIYINNQNSFALESSSSVKYTKETSNEERAETPTLNVKHDEKAPSDLDNIQESFFAAADAKSVGKMLATARERAGMTKIEAATAMNKGEKAVRDIEKGAHNATLPKIREYAEVLGLDVQIHLIPASKS